MKFSPFTFIIIAATGILVSACNTSTQEEKTQQETSVPAQLKESPIVLENNGIKLTEVENSPEFADATLALRAPADGANLAAGANKFEFEVTNFQLGEQTSADMALHCANSEKGQHIHYILNNAPYAAMYESTFEQELKDGKHLMLCFLSRSYHESIKNGKAFALQQLNVGKADKSPDFDLKAPMLFYSRPKGEYKGNDTKHLLLDFYLVNTSLSSDGNKVKVWVNGNEFLLPKWKPYLMEGLPTGENTIRIQLVDAEGNPVAGPYNDSGDRKITLN